MSDPGQQVEAARRCLAQAGVMAHARSRGPADQWGLAAAALHEARCLLEAGRASTRAASPAVVVPLGSCAELIWAALIALRAIPRERNWPQIHDAFRLGLVAFELVERQPAS